MLLIVRSLFRVRRYYKKTVVVTLIITVFFLGYNPLIFFEGSSKESRGTSLYEVAHAAINSAEKEYYLDIGPVNGSTTANYVFTTFFNPIGSGRTVSIKRISLRTVTASSTASNYVNLTLRHISAASGGTQITAANFPKKNASSSDSIVEVRYAGVTATLSGGTNSRVLGVPQSGAVGSYHGRRDISFGSSDEKIVIQPGDGLAVYQEAAGLTGSKVTLLIEWDENTNAPAATNEFLFAFPRVEVLSTANYVYNSFFNPVTSGKAAIIKRIWFGAETCDVAAVYTNSMILKRISAASAGTLVTAADIPKKNANGATSVMEFRHTNVTVTQVGGTAARIGHVTPCGTTNQSGGWQEINLHENDEKFILQQGEGIALITESVGDVDQLVRMIVEWQEVTTGSLPLSQGEYVWASDKVAAATVVNTSLYTFFNPVGSGKTAIISRLVIRANATTTSTYTSLQFRRLSASSGGTLIAASDLPKKHTGTSNSVMETRWCLQACSSAITASYTGTSDSRLVSVTAPGAVGQLIGQREVVFGVQEKIILQPGEGIGFYNDVLTSSVADAVKILIEWKEQVATPTALDEYLMDVGPINGNTATTYNYITFFNPVGSSRNAVLKRAEVRVDTVAAAVYVPISLRRISNASAGTLLASSSYPKKHTGTATSSMEIRTTGVTVTYAGATTSALLTVQTPGAIASAISGTNGYKSINFSDSEPLVLKPGEGIVLYQTPTAGDVDLRVRLLLEWKEQASSPTSLSEYLMTLGPVNQSLVANFVYGTLFNPLSSAKNYIVRKIGMQVNRNAAATNPTYTPVSLRRISAASAGTLIATTSVMKNTSTASSTAEVRSTGVTATFSGVADSKILTVVSPGVINQMFGNKESGVVLGDELVLQPGEGLALYQEQANGDVNSRYHFFFEWKEESNAPPAQSISFTISTSTVYFGTVSPTIARYASSTNVLGSDIEEEAHTFSVISNATNGYTVSAKGQTLTSIPYTILAVGGTATTSLVGTEQFGIRLVAIGGSGTSTSPYNSSSFAYDATATTSSQIAHATVGDNATTTFSVRYLTNIAPTTKPASYTANIIYVVTANF